MVYYATQVLNSLYDNTIEASKEAFACRQHHSDSRDALVRRKAGFDDIRILTVLHNHSYRMHTCVLLTS